MLFLNIYLTDKWCKNFAHFIVGLHWIIKKKKLEIQMKKMTMIQ